MERTEASEKFRKLKQGSEVFDAINPWHTSTLLPVLLNLSQTVQVSTCTSPPLLTRFQGDNIDFHLHESTFRSAQRHQCLGKKKAERGVKEWLPENVCSGPSATANAESSKEKLFRRKHSTNETKLSQPSAERFCELD